MTPKAKKGKKIGKRLQYINGREKRRKKWKRGYQCRINGNQLLGGKWEHNIRVHSFGNFEKLAALLKARTFSSLHKSASF
jgi:hypothetical protein